MQMTYLDVGIQSMGSKDGTGSLIPLSLILLVSRNVTGVCVGQTCNDQCHIAPGWLHLHHIHTYKCLVIVQTTWATAIDSETLGLKPLRSG